MILMYRYRLLPSKRQHRALEAILESQRQLYNAALEERIDCYRKTGKGVSYIDQCKSLTLCRRDLPEMRELPVKLQRWTLKRLDDAFQGFFRRAKARSNRAGFPRFRGKGLWRTFGFAEFEGISWNGKRLHVNGALGNLKLHLHRPIPNGAVIRSCAFRRDERGWLIFLAIDIRVAERSGGAVAIGVDLGLKVFAYCSDGVILPNPRIAKKAELAQRIAQRALARCRRGSNRRRKVKSRLARLHRKIAATRSTWLHQQSAALVLRYKAERAGAHLIEVDPKFTTQDCSGCGERMPKLLSQRLHHCPSCGLILDRDENAARNILARAVAGPQLPNVAQMGASVQLETSYQQ